MGFADKIKATYFFFEDKWYSFLDKLNKKIPVYKIIDPVDRVIPSFILFLLAVLFILILAGYFIQLSSPYDITLITHNSTTQVILSGVLIEGQLNGDDFSGTTGTNGEYRFTVGGSSKNFFETLIEIFIPTEVDISGYISANKEGFEEIKNKTLDLTSTQHKIYLAPLPDAPDYPSSTVVELRDSDSQDLIVSTDSLGYVKFKCNNKTITVKTVRDDADGVKDGKYTLAEDTCQFVVTSAFSTGYDVDSIQKILPITKNIHPINLDKVSIPTTGSARVYVYDFNSPENNKNYLDGIKVIFNGPDNTYSYTDDGFAEKTNLEAGEYIITITDNNYYEITADNNIKILVEPGKIAQIKIGLEKINPNDRRRVYLKIVDSVDGNVIKDVRVDLLWLTSDTNGNQYGTDGNVPLSYYSGTSHTDTNGHFIASDLTLRGDGQIVAILKKEGYIYKILKPTFFRLTEGPEVVQMDSANALNSGHAQIRVEGGDSNKPIARAQAYLYTEITIGGKTLKGIALEKNGKYTDSSGIANYSDLAIGINNYYLAQAKLGTIKSSLTSKKQVDANQTMFFNIHMNLNVSYLDIELLDFQTKARINTSPQATVEIYATDTAFSEINFSETLVYNSGFKSAGYLSTQPLLVKASLAGYVSQTVQINKTLQGGANKIRILMIPTSLATENVNVLFDNIYKKTDFLLDSNSTVEVLTQGEEYVGRFFAVIGKDMNYKKVISFGRFIGPTDITNISAIPLYLEEMDAFTCTTQISDNDATHDDNYYLPTLATCKDEGKDNKQAGFKWSDENLPPGVYTFLINFSIDVNASDDELIEMHYKAKEKHNPETETPLKKIEFYVGQPFTNTVSITAKLNNSAVPFSNNISPTINTIPGQTNKLKIKVFNNTTESVTSGYLKVYSYTGSTTGFSEISPPTSRIKFGSGANQTQATLTSNLQLAPFASSEYDINVYLNDSGIRGWVAIVMKANNETTVKFIDLKTKARELILDAEFLAMVNNQDFSGIVNSKFSNEDVTINDMTIDVRENCRNTLAQEASVHFYSGDSITKEIGYFTREIPGVYRNGVDCVIVDIPFATGPDGDYEPLNKKIYAGTGSAQDPSLACIEVETEGGEIRGDPDNLYLNWGSNGQINVINTCLSDAIIKVETGVVCSECNDEYGDSKEYPLASGSAKLFTVTGRNITYSQATNFSDILGYFPFTIKAKLSDGSLNKRFAIADEIGVHLRNENDCFVISKDVFDFLNEGDNQDFIIDNLCQDFTFEDYFVPKSQIRSLNINLNSETTRHNYIDFSWDLIASGGSYSISYTTSLNDYYGGITMIDLNALAKIVDSNSTKYIGASANFSDVDGNIDEIYLKWQDVADGDYFGAAVDGNIIITYKDGTKGQFQPKINTSPGANTSCVCNGADGGHGCTVIPDSNQNYCLIGKETQPGLDHLTYGITHNKIPIGEIEKIDFNIIGNSDLTSLTFKVTPHLIVQEKDPVITPTAGSGDQIFKSGSFRIYPIENATFILRNIAQDTSGTGLTQEESFCKESSGGKAWELGNKIYWIDPSYTTEELAEKTCKQEDGHTNLLSQEGTLVNLTTENETAILAMLNANIDDFDWLDSSIDDGLWTSTYNSKKEYTVLVENNGAIEKRLSNKNEIVLYAPFCVVDKEDGFDFNATECASNVTCDNLTNPPVCTLNESHAESNFFSDTFIAMINPKVKFSISAISSDSTAPLTTGAVVVWIEGKYLKAKFIGDDYAGYSDGSIELSLENDSSNNIQYSIINIKDYVNKGKVKN